VLGEFRKFLALLKTKRVYLIPILIGFNWNATYQSIYLTKYFSARARPLDALTSGIAGTAANVFWGWFLGLKCFSRPVVAKIAWFSFVLVMLSLFGRGGGVRPKVALDWDNPGFGRAFAVNVLFR
jgi:hypothetical protein